MTKNRNKIRQFLDIRNKNYGLFRVGLMSPRTYLGDAMECAQEHVRYIEYAYMQGVQLLVGPELGLNGGYTMQDAVHHTKTQDKSADALKYVLDETQSMDILLALGVIVKYQSVIYNAVVIAKNGRILAVIPKVELPNYLQFIEVKHFGTGEGIEDQITILGQTAPFGPDILIEYTDYPDVVLSVLVCEDFWATMDKGSPHAVNGATIFAVPSGSPDLVDKKRFQINLCKIRSSLYFGAVLYVSSGIGESSDLTVMGGRRIIAETGNLLIYEDRHTDRRGLSQHLGLTIQDIDTQVIAHERAVDSTFRANARRNRRKYLTVRVPGRLGIESDEPYQVICRTVLKHPFVPTDPAERKARAREIRDICVAGLIDKLTNTGINHVVIGISGGVDSLEALTVCLEAFDALDIPRANIHAITMPGQSTQSATYDRAIRTIQHSEVSFAEISVGDIAQFLLKKVGHDGVVQNITYENAHADARKDILFLSTSDKPYVAIVIGTSGLTEILLGWCTKFADHSFDWGPNISKPKSMIRFLVHEYAREILETDPDSQFAKVCIETADAQPTPDLADDQITEDKIGNLDVHDFWIAHFLRYGMSPLKMLRLIVESGWLDDYDIIYLKKVMRIFIERRFGNHHKTAVPMLGPMIGTANADTHKVLQWPTDMTPGAKQAWLDDLALVPDNLF